MATQICNSLSQSIPVTTSNTRNRLCQLVEDLVTFDERRRMALVVIQQVVLFCKCVDIWLQDDLLVAAKACVWKLDDELTHK